MKWGDILNNTNVKNDGEHSLSLVSRNFLKLSGVLQIINFDDVSAVLSTSCGEMEISGENLSIDLLDLDNGIASLSGMVAGINYYSDHPKKKHWFRGK